MSIKSLKKQLMAAIAMVLVAAIALGSSTYAWFVSNTKVTAESAELTAKTSYALLISKDAEGVATNTSDWASIHHNTNSTANELVPVSTNGAGSLTPTGTLLFAASNTWDADGTLVNGYKEPATTDYWTESFQIKASQACKLFLSNDTNFNVDRSDKAALQGVLRLALVVKKKGEAASTAKVFMYEVDNTPTAAAANTTTGVANGTEKAIKCTYTPVSAGTAIVKGTAVDTISAQNYVAAVADPETPGHIPTLAASKVDSDGSALVAAATYGSIEPIYTFANPEEVVDITAYIWMEGCDYDCISANISTLTEAANKLRVNLGFCAGSPTA